MLALIGICIDDCFNVCSDSYFTLMSDAGLFDPIINFLIKRTGKSITTVFDRGSVNNLCGTFRWIWCNNIFDRGSCIFTDL